MLPKEKTSLAFRLAKDLLDKKEKLSDVGKRGSSQNQQKRFSTRRGASANGGLTGPPTASTLRPVRSRIGRHRMANRVIRESIWTSQSLAKLSREAEAWFPRWVLMADDWGCFQADPRIVKGTAYPLRDDVTPKEVEGWLVEYYNSGHIFVWSDGERYWGFFTAFDRQNSYFNKTQVGENEKQAKHRRKTPEPPADKLSLYTKARQVITNLCNILGQDRTVADKYRVPIPIPHPVPIPINTKDIPAETTAKDCTPEETFTKSQLEENKAKVAEMVKGLADGMTVEGKRKFRPRTQNQQMLDEEIKQAQAIYSQKFGKHINPSQVMLLVNGRNGKRFSCFGSIPTLMEFWKDQQKDLEDPFSFSLASARNPQTVARYEKRAFEAK